LFLHFLALRFAVIKQLAIVLNHEIDFSGLPIKLSIFSDQ